MQPVLQHDIPHPSCHGACEKTATITRPTPNPPWSTVASGCQAACRTTHRPSTASPKRTNTVWVTQAPGSPWAAASVVPMPTHE